jgi:lipopolysaccharide export system permease protein
MILERYIFRKCLFNTILVLFAFVSLFAVFTILGELNNLGVGDFNMMVMLVYISALMPNFAYLLMPLSVLIGVMLGMLGLVTYSEYAIIRTSGMSLRRITIILSIFGIIFTLITFVLGEIVAPQADHFAQAYKMTKLNRMVSTNLQSGIWSKDGTGVFVNIKHVMPNNQILGVNVFYYNESRALVKYLRANQGTFDANQKTWLLNDVVIEDYTESKINISNIATINWKTGIDPSYFSVLVVAPEEMSVFALIKYMKHLIDNNQSVRRYEIAFWSKLIYPITCLSMALLAIAFIPNNRRNVSLGSKLFVGIIIGVSFFFLIKLIGYLAVIFSWNPIVALTTPTVLLFLGGWYFILRKDK